MDLDLNLTNTFSSAGTVYGPGLTSDSMVFRREDDTFVERRRDGTEVPRDWLGTDGVFGVVTPNDYAADGTGWVLVVTGFNEVTLARADGSQRTVYPDRTGGGFDPLKWLE